MQSTKGKELKSMDLVYLAILLIVVGSVSAFSFSAHEPASDQNKAIRRAENLALQLKQIRVRNLKQMKQQELVGEESGRSPASVKLGQAAMDQALSPFKKSGDIGTDPWGNPYSYDTFDQGDSSYLLIWSAGRDGKKSSDSTEILLAVAEDQSPPYRGDDIGLILPLEP